MHAHRLIMINYRTCLQQQVRGERLIALRKRSKVRYTHAHTHIYIYADTQQTQISRENQEKKLVIITVIESRRN